MGLFGKLFGGDEQQTQAPASNTPIQTASTEGREVTLDLNKGGMLNLAKNDFLNLSKTDFSLENIRVSAGWDVKTSLFGSDFDLDLCAFLLDSSGHLTRSVNNLVYFSKKKSQGIQLDHDNLTGAGDGDDENMFVNFNNIHPDVAQIVVAVVIYSGQNRKQYFGQVKNAYVRLVDQARRPEKEIARFNLSEDGGKATAVKFAELTRTVNGWTFKAVGEYLNASIQDIEKSYR